MALRGITSTPGTIDQATLAKLVGDPANPIASYTVGNPEGDFAGQSPLELALDPASGVHLQTDITSSVPLSVTVLNPTQPNFPAIQAVNPSLPPNAAAENNGQLAQIQQLLQLILIELRLSNHQAVVGYGITDEQETFRNDPSLYQLIS